MSEILTWLCLAGGILLCGVITIIQLVLVTKGSGSGALVLFLVSGAVLAGLITVAVLRIRRGNEFWK
jgi:hypothetical protein